MNARSFLLVDQFTFRHAFMTITLLLPFLILFALVLEISKKKRPMIRKLSKARSKIRIKIILLGRKEAYKKS